MSAKPTPGPFDTFKVDGGTAIHVNGVCIGVFYDREGCNNEISEEQAEANARAWVDGREATENLERIRDIIADMGDAPSVLGHIAIIRIAEAIGFGSRGQT